MILSVLKAIGRSGIAFTTLATLEARWRLKGKFANERSHGLDKSLIVSLTSYPPRYNTLLPTLKSLFLQSVRPDAIELWIAKQDYASLPKGVLALSEQGLIIKTCSDIRSFKKIIPALQEHPEAIVVTADDDIYYWPTWLEELAKAYRPSVREVICHRAHEIVFEGARPVSYGRWRFNTAITEGSCRIFPTGVGGILYQPGIFAADVTREDLFQRYCPTADDVWLFWMASLNGATFRKIGPLQRLVLWPHGQEVALFNQNAKFKNANDVQIAAMISAYGFPAAPGKYV
jgi:hypothetical protein